MCCSWMFKTQFSLKRWCSFFYTASTNSTTAMVREPKGQHMFHWHHHMICSEWQSLGQIFDCVEATKGKAENLPRQWFGMMVACPGQSIQISQSNGKYHRRSTKYACILNWGIEPLGFTRSGFEEYLSFLRTNLLSSTYLLSSVNSLCPCYKKFCYSL